MQAARSDQRRTGQIVNTTFRALRELVSLLFTRAAIGFSSRIHEPVADDAAALGIAEKQVGLDSDRNQNLAHQFTSVFIVGRIFEPHHLLNAGPFSTAIFLEGRDDPIEGTYIPGNISLIFGNFV